MRLDCIDTAVAWKFSTPAAEEKKVSFEVVCDSFFATLDFI